MVINRYFGISADSDNHKTQLSSAMRRILAAQFSEYFTEEFEKMDVLIFVVSILFGVGDEADFRENISKAVYYKIPKIIVFFDDMDEEADEDLTELVELEVEFLLGEYELELDLRIFGSSLLASSGDDFELKRIWALIDLISKQPKRETTFSAKASSGFYGVYTKHIEELLQKSKTASSITELFFLFEPKSLDNALQKGYSETLLEYPWLTPEAEEGLSICLDRAEKRLSEMRFDWNSIQNQSKYLSFEQRVSQFVFDQSALGIGLERLSGSSRLSEWGDFQDDRALRETIRRFSAAVDDFLIRLREDYTALVEGYVS